MSKWVRCQNKAIGGIYIKNSEELTLYILAGSDFDILNPGLKVVSSNAYPGWTVPYLGLNIRIFCGR